MTHIETHAFDQCHKQQNLTKAHIDGEITKNMSVTRYIVTVVRDQTSVGPYFTEIGHQGTLTGLHLYYTYRTFNF